MKMNLLILLALCPMLFGACSDSSNNDEPVELVLELTAAPLSYTVEAEGEELSLAITSNTIWKISYDNTSFFRPSITTAKGDASIKITVDANATVNERSGLLYITDSGMTLDAIEVNITQSGSDEPVEPEVPDYIDPDETDMRALTSLELSALMGKAWNLGNSLEAISVSVNSETGEITYSGGETSWGNPATTKQLIDAVKAAGFKTVRIPVSWSHKLSDKTNYTISADWLNRVEEVVNYALDNEMYAIINVHWDGGWMDHPYYTEQEAINTRLAAYWKQIAKHFRDYSDFLLFAGTNEVHVEGSWAAPSTENVTVQNSFNQTFVDAVRATGGHNTYRHLVVQGYNTNIDHTVNHFVLPGDNTANRQMVEVHFYDPYEFALKEDVPYNTLWGADYAGGDVTSWGQEDWVDEAFAKMKNKFVNNNVAVILGEYGSIYRSSLTGIALEQHITARNNYLKYETKAAIDNQLVPVYWDNGYAGNNGFALFNRQNGEVVNQASVDAIISADQ